MKTAKKALSVLLSILMVLAAIPAAFVPAFAEDDPPQADYLWSYDDETATLTVTGNGALPDFPMFEAPSELLTASPWLSAAADAETLVIGEGITGIGSFNFALMGELTTVTLPESLTHIGSYAFAYCPKLRDITLPAGLTELGEGSFMFNSLQSVDIPAGVRSLNYNFMYQCSLTSVTLHEGLESIVGCFEYCPIGSITIPSTVTTMQGCMLLDTKTLVNRSADVVASDALMSVSEPGMGGILGKYYTLSIQMELRYMLSGENIDPETEAQFEAQILDELRVWLNETYNAGLETNEQAMAYIEPYMSTYSFPRADAEIYCLSDSAEHTHLDSVGLPHYLIDRDNEMCSVEPRGAAGDHITWSLDRAAGVLTFTGSGDMYSLGQAGYKFYRNEIAAVSFVQEGGAITSIGYAAFKGLTALTSLTVPEGVLHIESDFIRDSGVRALTLPSTLNAYQNSEWLRLGSAPLESISLNGTGGVYYLYNGALYRNFGTNAALVKYLPDAVGQPMADNLTVIDAYAAEGLSGLTEFTVPGTVDNIQDYAFADMPALRTLSFGAGTGDSFYFASRFCRNTGVTALNADPADTRFTSVDGVLYTKDVTELVALPECIAEADLPATVKRVYNDEYLYTKEPLQRLTVRNASFRFPDSWYTLSFVDDGTVIAGWKDSTAQDYALWHGNPLELLDGVTITGIELDFSEARLTVPQYEEFLFTDFGVKANVTYSDGTASVKTGSQLTYEYTDENNSTSRYSCVFEELGEYQITVRYGSAAETFTATVVESDIRYEFDTSDMFDEISVYELFNPTEMNVRLYRVNADDTREEIDFWSVQTYYWDETAGETDWTPSTGTRTFDSPRDVRLRFEYRGNSMETVLHVTENAVKFTVDTSAFVTEAEQFSVYNKDNCGLRILVTRDGETRDLTPDMTLRDGTQYDSWYGSSCLNTFDLGAVPATANCQYSYNDPVRGYVDFSVSYPFTLNVVPGEITAVDLDISGVTDTVQPYREYTAGQLGVKLVKTMANGDTVIDDDPPVTFQIAHDYSFSYSPTLYAGGLGEVYTLTARYITLQKSFTVTVRQTGEYTIDDSNAVTVFRQYLDTFTPAALNLRLYRTADGETEELTDYSRISYGWSDGMPSANAIGTHTVKLYYILDDGMSEEIGEVQYEVVDSGAELLLNGTPTVIDQYETFLFSAAAVAYDNGVQVSLTQNLRFYVNDENHNTVSWDTLPTHTPGVYTVTPLAILNGSYVYFYDWAFEVTVVPAEPTFRLDLTNLVTEIGTYQLYSADTWGVRGWRTQNGEDREEMMVQFWFEMPNGERRDNCIPTDAPGAFVLHPYIFLGVNQYEVGNPITVTVTDSGMTYAFSEYSYADTLPQFAAFNFRARINTYRNGEAYQNMLVYKYIAEDAAGNEYDNYLLTQFTGEYTVTPYYDYNGNRLFGAPVTVTVVPVEMPALAPTDEKAVNIADGQPAAYTFTAPADGDYTFSAVLTAASPANCYPVAHFYGDDLMVSFTYGGNTGSGFSYTRYLTAGTSYTITLLDFHNTESGFLFCVDHVHRTAFTAEVPSTCEIPGTAAHYTCGICGKNFADADGTQALDDLTLPLAAHTPEAHGANDPTCSVPGNVAYWTCSVCGRYFSDALCENEIGENDTVIPAGHSLEAHAACDADCVSDGSIAYWYCARCGKYWSDEALVSEIGYEDTVIPGGHVMAEHPGTGATCTENGNLPYYECTRCGRFFIDGSGSEEIADHSEVILPAHHSLTRTPGKAATCAAAGNIEYWTCSVCGNKYSDANATERVTDVTLPKLNTHTWNAGAETVPATCTAVGKKTYTCTVCGATKNEDIPKASHRDNNGDGVCDYGCGTVMGGQPEQPTDPGQPSGGDKCPLCGETHTGFFGKIVGFFHRIAYFFQNLFKR